MKQGHTNLVGRTGILYDRLVPDSGADEPIEVIGIDVMGHAIMVRITGGEGLGEIFGYDDWSKIRINQP
jgi:hypothetical protein